MAELNLRFELAATADAAATAKAIETRLARLPSVSEAEALPPEPRIGALEVVGAISAAIVVLKSGRELVAELRNIIPEIKKLVQEIKGLKSPTVEVGTRRVNVENLTESDLAELGKN